MFRQLRHRLHPTECFVNAAWVGNLYSCPVCGNSIALGTDGGIYPFPRYMKYKEQIKSIPPQPLWYVQQKDQDAVRDFMLHAFDSIGDFYIIEEYLHEDEEPVQENKENANEELVR